jgi:hypothetical protein
VDNLSPFFTEKKNKGKGFFIGKSKGKKKQLWGKIEWDLQRLDWQGIEDETESGGEGGEDGVGTGKTGKQNA